MKSSSIALKSTWIVLVVIIDLPAFTTLLLKGDYIMTGAKSMNFESTIITFKIHK